jgi:hypothetical protein
MFLTKSAHAVIRSSTMGPRGGEIALRSAMASRIAATSRGRRSRSDGRTRPDTPMSYNSWFTAPSPTKQVVIPLAKRGRSDDERGKFSTSARGCEDDATHGTSFYHGPRRPSRNTPALRSRRPHHDVGPVGGVPVVHDDEQWQEGVADVGQPLVLAQEEAVRAAGERGLFDIERGAS